MPPVIIPDGTTEFIPANGNTTYILPSDVTIENFRGLSGDFALTGNTLLIDGTIDAAGNDGLITFETGSAYHIRSGGSIMSDRNGVLIFGDDNFFQNDGSVTADPAGPSAVEGVGFDGDNHVGVNTGTIKGVFFGVRVFPANNFQFTNTGDILATNGAAFHFESVAGSTLSNAGLIRGTAEGVSYSSTNTGIHTLFNSGTILASSGPRAIDGGNATNIIINTGTMRGNVSLDGGNDFFNNRDGSVTGTIFGEGGADFILGGSADETLNGGGDDDRLHGGLGGDILAGAGGSDVLFGEGGNDTIRGGAGNDLMVGGFGADLLNGFSGSDIMDGGAGDDTLIGGLGDDVFRFRADAGSDRIFGWENGSDLIDLTSYNTTTGTLAMAVSNIGGNAVIDLAVLGGSGTITVQGAAGLIETTDFLL